MAGSSTPQHAGRSVQELFGIHTSREMTMDESAHNIDLAKVQKTAADLIASTLLQRCSRGVP